MTNLDYAVFAAYMVGLLAMGAIFARRMKNSVDMFAAGNQAPWWVAGLSGFMTSFSAGTFVVWGGVACRLGMVAVAILMTNGIAALLVGYTVATRWRRLGITTAAEYVEMRFGRNAVYLYTSLFMVVRMFAVGIALYSIAVVLCALVPLPEDNYFRDPATGHLAVPWAVVLGGGVVITYTVIGGLWAVLMNDVFQFIVLALSTLVTIPLCLSKMGGIGRFVADSPDGFLMPAAGEYTWLFLAIFSVMTYLRVGSEWAFVQRYLCVPTPKDAKKAACLFGILYLVSPILWMLPPMLCRVMRPEVNHEQAYIVACQMVLPAGMIGLMLAAMFSATASMADSELNVFAGVLTRDFYARLFKLQNAERHLMWAGRLFVIAIGAIVLLIALVLPRIGGAEKTVLSITGLFAGPMLLPSIWGLFSRRIGWNAVWLSAVFGFAAGGLLKFGLLRTEQWLGDGGTLGFVMQWIMSNRWTVELMVGLGAPLTVL
ncbi:MAG: Na+:solute symporter, partial [Pirellulaceae bacterium]|nr:Na+:solute symporter [Pirellulaceae bacterium]